MNDLIRRVFVCWGPRNNNDGDPDMNNEVWEHADKQYKRRIRNKNADFTGSLNVKAKKEVPKIKIAINQVSIQYGETNPGNDLEERNWNGEAELMK